MVRATVPYVYNRMLSRSHAFGFMYTLMSDQSLAWSDKKNHNAHWYCMGTGWLLHGTDHHGNR